LRGHEPQRIERIGPAMEFPRDAADVHLNVVCVQRLGKIAARSAMAGVMLTGNVFWYRCFARTMAAQQGRADCPVAR
jgi:hypothetical protein